MVGNACQETRSPVQFDPLPFQRFFDRVTLLCGQSIPKRAREGRQTPALQLDRTGNNVRSAWDSHSAAGAGEGTDERYPGLALGGPNDEDSGRGRAGAGGAVGGRRNGERIRMQANSGSRFLVVLLSAPPGRHGPASQETAARDARPASFLPAVYRESRRRLRHGKVL